MKAIETIGHRINEFEARIYTIANYRNKRIVVSCVSAIKADEESFYVFIPEDIKLMNRGKLTENMAREAKRMFYDLRYTELR